jgi:hypothetical protein
LIAAEWAFLIVVGDDVLAQFRTDGLEGEPGVADHGEVPQVAWRL